MDNKSKRKLKREPNFNLTLNEEQKIAKSKVFEYDVNFFHGDFGSGKTLLACNIALTLFRKKEVNKIVITRPIVRHIGFLPGDVKEKLDPYIAPIIHNFNMLQSKETTERMLSKGDIDILPVDFAKGITYVDSIVIIDEYEDLNYEDFRMMLSRLGKNSKLIFCGSKEQIEKTIGKNSCIYETMKLKDTGLVGYSTLKSNHRNPAILEILKYLENE